MTVDIKTKILCIRYDKNGWIHNYGVFLNEDCAKKFFGDSCWWKREVTKWITTWVRDEAIERYELLPINEYSYINDPLLKELELLRKGVELAFKRETHPSYVMELQAILQTADLCIRLTKHLIEKLESQDKIPLPDELRG